MTICAGVDKYYVDGWTGIVDGEKLIFRLERKPDNDAMTLSLFQQRTQREFSLTIPLNTYWIHAVLSGGGESVELSLEDDSSTA